MKRLVVHAGARQTGWAPTQRQLVQWRAALARADVRIPAADDPASWHRLTRAALGVGDAAELEELLASAGADETVLLGSDEAEDLLQEPDRVSALAALARRHGGEAVVVLLMRDQLDQVNRSYCRRVLDLRTAVSFEEFAHEAAQDQRFDPRRRCAALLADDGVTLAAVPSTGVDPARPAAAVLAAAGKAVPDDLPAAGRPDPVPGPALVAATRLLHKRLWRHGAFQRHDRADLVRLARRLRQAAEQRGWDDAEFWGWTPALRKAVAGPLVEADRAFAEQVWGTPWPVDGGSRQTRVTRLTTAAPALVADVVDTVQALVLEAEGDAAGPAKPKRTPMRSLVQRLRSGK
jgi:hypothetical protein